MNDSVKKFKEDGFLVIENIVNQNLLDQMIYLIAARFTSITKIKLNDAIIINGNVSKEFEENLINLRKNNPDVFGFLYDSIQSSINLTQLLTDNKLISAACAVVEGKIEDYSTSGHIQRIDPPTDRKNLYSWHQETSYYRQNSTGKNCFFIWVPLFDIDKTTGSVILAKSSHKKGYYETDVKINSKFGSEQRHVDDAHVKNFEKVHISMKKGDACIIDFNTVHASGHNETKSIRYTAIGRYHFTNTKDFRPFRNKFDFNNLLTNK